MRKLVAFEVGAKVWSPRHACYVGGGSVLYIQGGTKDVSFLAGPCGSLRLHVLCMDEAGDG